MLGIAGSSLIPYEAWKSVARPPCAAPARCRSPSKLLLLLHELQDPSAVRRLCQRHDVRTCCALSSPCMPCRGSRQSTSDNQRTILTRFLSQHEASFTALSKPAPGQRDQFRRHRARTQPLVGVVLDSTGLLSSSPGCRMHIDASSGNANRCSCRLLHGFTSMRSTVDCCTSSRSGFCLPGV